MYSHLQGLTIVSRESKPTVEQSPTDGKCLVEGFKQLTFAAKFT